MTKTNQGTKTPTKHYSLLAIATCISLLTAGHSTPVLANNRLSCAVNSTTQAHMCFPNNKVRVNGEVRSAPFYKGGPKGADDTGFTARVHCASEVMELTDRQGVAFIRNKPTEQIGKDFVRILCAHINTKKDPNLRIN